MPAKIINNIFSSTTLMYSQRNLLLSNIGACQPPKYLPVQAPDFCPIAQVEICDRVQGQPPPPLLQQVVRCLAQQQLPPQRLHLNDQQHSGLQIPYPCQQCPLKPLHVMTFCCALLSSATSGACDWRQAMICRCSTGRWDPPLAPFLASTQSGLSTASSAAVSLMPPEIPYTGGQASCWTFDIQEHKKATTLRFLSLQNLRYRKAPRVFPDWHMRGQGACKS